MEVLFGHQASQWKGDPGFLLKKSLIYRGMSIAMFDYQRVSTVEPLFSVSERFGGSTFKGNCDLPTDLSIY